MKTSIFIATIVVLLTAVAAVHAGPLGIPAGGRLSIQSYGPGMDPFSGQSVTSVSYRQPGYSAGFFRDAPAGLSFGGVTSRDFNGGYAYNNGFSYANVKSSTVSGSIYRTTSGYRTGTNSYGGGIMVGRGAVDSYRYQQPTIYGNAYGRPYGYDRMGSSYY